MKVALCFLISYEHILQKEKLWINWIKSNEDLFNIYFHYKDSSKIKSPWIKKYIIPKRYIKETSYYNVVPAYITLFSYAYVHDKNNEWFCILTDSCCPIISPCKFRKLFFNYHDKSIIKCKPAHWNVEYHTRANLKLLNTKYHLANDPWFTLCRYHMQLCLLFVGNQNGLYKQINSGGLANESLFAIILHTFRQINEPTHLLNYSSNVADWSRMSNPTSPYLFKELNDYNIMIINDILKENPFTMFMRKIHYNCPDEDILKIIEENKNDEKCFNSLSSKTILINKLHSCTNYLVYYGNKFNKKYILFLFLLSIMCTCMFAKVFVYL